MRHQQNVSTRVHYAVGVANGIMQTDDAGQVARRIFIFQMQLGEQEINFLELQIVHSIMFKLHLQLQNQLLLQKVFYRIVNNY